MAMKQWNVIGAEQKAILLLSGAHAGRVPQSAPSFRKWSLVPSVFTARKLAPPSAP